MIPQDASSGGCISAWSTSTGDLVGRSSKQQFNFVSPAQPSSNSLIEQRGAPPQRIEMSNSTGVDVWGAWFEGIELLKNAHVGAVDAAAAKRSNIAIVGAGMSGLMTYLCLAQQGLTNISIIEASNRLGGRVRTVYLSGGPSDYSYQEMGPMRLPTTLTIEGEKLNISDHQLVFQLAQELNALNNNREDLRVDFIPWYETSDNLPHPRPLAGMDKVLKQVNTILSRKDFCVDMATNMFKAHRIWLDNGLKSISQEPWSEYAFTVNYMAAKAVVNATEYQPILSGPGPSCFWDDLCGRVYANATTWTTVDGGMDRLPLAFAPLVGNITSLNSYLEGASYSPQSGTVSLHSRRVLNGTATLINSTHDYVVLAVPFSAMKSLQLPPVSAMMRNAIENVPYIPACKVALEFQTRFWEHLEKPIYGSCWTAGPEFGGIGSMCYPSYNINGTGKAAVLASYTADPTWTKVWETTPEGEHIAYVLDAMERVHGPIVREQYTGKHSRVCWMVDPLEGGGWADPSVEQHQLYLPEYFKTHNNVSPRLRWRGFSLLTTCR